MQITLEETKKYLRVDSSDEDDLIRHFMDTAGRLVTGVSRNSEEELLEHPEVTKTAEMYAVAYLYEHREEADHKNLVGTLRSLLFSIRKEEF